VLDILYNKVILTHLNTYITSITDYPQTH